MHAQFKTQRVSMNARPRFPVESNVPLYLARVRRIGVLVLGVFIAISGELAPRAVGADIVANASELGLRVQWRERPADGEVEVRHGELADVTISSGNGRVDGNGYHFAENGPARLELSVRNAQLGAGGGATVITIGSGGDGFSFFARDVAHAFPIFLPDRGVAVSLINDARSYQEIADAISQRGTLTKLQRFEAEPEADFDSASRVTRDQHAPTWLGLGRDSRLFKISHALDGNGLEQDVIRITRGSTAMPLILG